MSRRPAIARHLAEITYKLLEAKLKMLLTLRMLFCILVNVARAINIKGA
jgi:hypothetical protein